MNKTLKILPPSMPNFYSYEQPPGIRQDGFNTTRNYPISNLTKEEAIEFGEMMKQTFISHWEKLKNKPSDK